jgi:predicted dehydrogenase
MQRANRREFLRRSSCFLGGSTFAAALAGAGKSRAAGQAANDKIVLAVMGVHGRGRDLARGFSRQKNTEVAYICDVDQKVLDDMLIQWDSDVAPEPKTARDVRTVLDDKDVDALVIATPDHWHATATVWACAAGKHVYVEKPASHNGYEGQLMIAAAEKYSRHVQLGTQRRSSPHIAEALQKLKEGEYGRALFARGWINSTRPNIGRGKAGPPPAHLDFESWQGPAPTTEFRDNVVHYNWHWFWRWGTGELGNNGIHAIDVCRWGLDVTAPEKVTCGGGRLFFDDDQETPDTQIATFHFGEKVINWEHRTWTRRGFENSLFGIQFYTDHGALRFTDEHIVSFDMDGKETSREHFSGGESEHLANFLACIRGDAPLNAPITSGVASTALCHLGNIAYRTGRTVLVEPDTGAPTGDEEAESLWRREYRSGWELTV